MHLNNLNCQLSDRKNNFRRGKGNAGALPIRTAQSQPRERHRHPGLVQNPMQRPRRPRKRNQSSNERGVRPFVVGGNRDLAHPL